MGINILLSNKARGYNPENLGGLNIRNQTRLMVLTFQKNPLLLPLPQLVLFFDDFFGKNSFFQSIELCKIDAFIEIIYRKGKSITPGRYFKTKPFYLFTQYIPDQ